MNLLLPFALTPYGSNAGAEIMCPACMASAALMVAGVISTGGLTALAARLFHPTTSSHSKSTTDQIWPKEPKRKEQ